MLYGKMLHGQMLHGQMLYMGHLSPVKGGSKNLNWSYSTLPGCGVGEGGGACQLYQTDTWGLVYSVGHIGTKCCIYLTNMRSLDHKIKVIFQLFEFGKKSEKMQTPSLSQS